MVVLIVFVVRMLSVEFLVNDFWRITYKFFKL